MNFFKSNPQISNLNPNQIHPFQNISNPNPNLDLDLHTTDCKDLQVASVVESPYDFMNVQLKVLLLEINVSFLNHIGQNLFFVDLNTHVNGMCI